VNAIAIAIEGSASHTLTRPWPPLLPAAAFPAAALTAPSLAAAALTTAVRTAAPFRQQNLDAVV